MAGDKKESKTSKAKAYARNITFAARVQNHTTLHVHSENSQDNNGQSTSSAALQAQASTQPLPVQASTDAVPHTSSTQAGSSESPPVERESNETSNVELTIEYAFKFLEKKILHAKVAPREVVACLKAIEKMKAILNDESPLAVETESFIISFNDEEK